MKRLMTPINRSQARLEEASLQSLLNSLLPLSSSDFFLDDIKTWDTRLLSVLTVETDRWLGKKTETQITEDVFSSCDLEALIEAARDPEMASEYAEFLADLYPELCRFEATITHTMKPLFTYSYRRDPEPVFSFKVQG